MKVDKLKIGFIGLGGMGERMARRLIQAGFELTAYDRTAQRMDSLVEAGAMAAHSLSMLSANSDVIISCVTNDQAVLDIYAGKQGVLSAARRGTIVIEMSTVLSETSQKLAELARERGVEVLDVPVSGSTPAAEQGTLNLFGGGKREIFDRGDPIFRALSRQHHYLGPSGSGSTMKLVVNTLLGVEMQAIAEATALGERAGLDRTRMLEVLAQTAVVAPAHPGKLLRASRSDYSPQFPIRLMRKDFGLILDLAGDLRVPMPTTIAAAAENRACEFVDLDFSCVMEEMRMRANCEKSNPVR